MPIKKGGPHGLWKVVAQLVGTYGNSYGVAGESLAAGSDSQAIVLDYPTNCSYQVPDRVTVDFTGGDRWITSFQYGITSLGQFDFTTRDEDADFVALITGTNVNQTTNDQWSEYTYDELSGTRPQLSLMIIHRMQSFEPATFGTTFYVHTIIPRCWIAPKSFGKAFQTVSEPAYQVTPASGTRRFNGLPFGSELNADQNAVAAYHIIAPYPLYMVVGRSDGTSYQVTSAYKPLETTVGTATSTKNHIVKFVESTQVATAGVADTINVTNGTFDVGTALTVAADDMIAVLHETAYEAVA